VAYILQTLLSFDKLHVKQTHFSGRSISSAVVLNFQISQGSAAI